MTSVFTPWSPTNLGTTSWNSNTDDGWIRITQPIPTFATNAVVTVTRVYTKNEIYRPRMLEMQSADARREVTPPRLRAPAVASRSRPLGRESRGPSWRLRRRAPLEYRRAATA